MTIQRRAFLAAAGSASAVAALPKAVRAQSGRTLRIGVVPIEPQAEAYYALERGLFTKAGLNVEIVAGRNGAAIATAVVGGDLVAGCSSIISLAQAKQRNINFVVVAPASIWDTSNPTGKIVVSPDSAVHDAKDLNGKVIGLTALNGLDQLTFQAYLAKNGGDPASLKFLEVPNSAQVEALVQGRVAATLLNEPVLSAQSARVRPLALGQDAIARTFVQTAWFSTAEYLAKNKELMQRFADAIFGAGAWAMENPVPAAAVLEKYLGSREPRARARFATGHDDRLVQPLLDAAAAFKEIAPLSAADLVWNGR